MEIQWTFNIGFPMTMVVALQKRHLVSLVKFLRPLGENS